MKSQLAGNNSKIHRCGNFVGGYERCVYCDKLLCEQKTDTPGWGKDTLVRLCDNGSGGENCEYYPIEVGIDEYCCELMQAYVLKRFGH